ncbi:hypothetical protein LCGC14_1601000 [marine sediment metagenome]|uniref:Uncharacterized protein n=1 Tax=marine sediment metagenome TaxID=412755 RepID=A0A0F9IXN5_9ZZZZ
MTFEEVPVGTLFARQDWHPLDHKPHEVYVKLRDSFRWHLPDGSGYMNVNAIKIKNGARRSVNSGESVKKVTFLLGIKEIFAAIRRKQ